MGCAMGDVNEGVNRAMTVRHGWHKIGTIAVDSGTIVVVDPCYIESGFDLKPVFVATDGDRHGGERVFAGTHGTGVVVASGGGDGSYPLSAYYDEEGIIREVSISFWDEDEESEGI